MSVTPTSNPHLSSRQILDRYPFCWRTGIERVRQIWRVALHPKFRPEIQFLRPFLAPGCGCLDIGANHGRFAIELAHRGHRVLAFEPLRFNLTIIRPATALHRHVRVIPSALGESAGSALLYVPIRSDSRPEHGSGFVAADDIEAAHRMPDRRLVRESIAITRLDDVDLGWVDPIGLIKMDVEGHEAAVLRGGSKVIEQFRPTVLMESQRDGRGLDALSELAARGYTMYDLDRREAGFWSRDPKAIHAEIAAGPKSHDVLAWHTGNGKTPDFGASFETTRFGR